MTTQTIPQQAPQAVRWTRAEFAHLVRAGLLAGRRVELIEGEILEMPAMLGPHRVAVIKVGDALRAITGSGHFVQQQVPLAVGDRTEPEPDAAAVPGAPDDYLSDAPTRPCSSSRSAIRPLSTIVDASSISTPAPASPSIGLSISSTACWKSTVNQSRT